MSKNYLSNYFDKFSKLLVDYNHKDFLKIVKLLKEVKRNKKKVIIVGNGGSAAMASHVSVDVGSNIGDFSKEILKNKNTNVVAFEPIPECFSSLKKIKNDYGDRFIYFKCALSNKRGSAYINFNKNSHDLASLESSISKIDYIKKQNINRINIELEKLDNFIDNNYFSNIDFVKIDTEGHEIKVLEGGINFLHKNKVKLIQIEFNWHHLFVNNSIFQFSEILKDYVVTQMNLADGKLFVVDQNHYQSNLFQLSNFVFVEKEFFEKNSIILLG